MVQQKCLKPIHKLVWRLLKFAFFNASAFSGRIFYLLGGFKMSTETTKNKPILCSSCHGKIEINTSEEFVECPYCGTKYAVSDLLDESDTVRIEKIRTDAYQKIEQEKLRHETEKDKTEEENAVIEKFKKSKFGKILLVFFAISVIFLFLADGFFVKSLVFIQALLFIGAWLMGSRIIKEPFKGLHNILGIVAFVLILPIISSGGGGTSVSSKKEKFNWEDIELNEVLPKPKSNKGNIIQNTDETLFAYISKYSQADYKDYITACKDKGFDVGVEKAELNYSAYNSEGYDLSLTYDESDKELLIDLNAPVEMLENAWIETPLSKLVPEPVSKVGKVETNTEKDYVYFAGNTSEEDFLKYSNALLSGGFDKEYSSGDKYFNGKNSEGYKVSLDLKGNSVMEIYISAPNDMSNTNITTQNEASGESESKSSDGAGNSEIGQDFKNSMDKYEAFMDEYVAFMEKYAKSGGTDVSLLADFTNYMSKYEEYVKSFEKWEDEDLNAAETAYYLEVQTRVAKKLAEVSYLQN